MGFHKKTRSFFVKNGFLIAGNDPYKYKGLEEIAKPILRPDVLDGKTKWY